MEQKSIKKNLFYTIILKMLNVLFPILTFPYVARVLLPEGIGKIDFSLSIIQYFIIFALLGIPIYAVRECAINRNDKKMLSKTVQELLFINIIGMLISYLLFIVIIFTISQLSSYRYILMLMSINIFSTVFSVTWFYEAIEDYKYITIRNIVIKLVSLVMIFVFVKDTSDVLIYVIITVFSLLLGSLYNFFHMNKYINILKLYSNYNFKKHLKPIFLLFAMSLSVSIYINLDKTMLGLIIGDDAVGLYSAASKITKIILVFATSLGTILLPRMSYLINKKNDYEIKKLITKSLDFTLLISLPIVTGLFLLGEPIILVFVGSDYISSVTTLKILSLVILPIGLTNLIGIQILVSHGLEKFTILSTVIAAIINLTLNYILIPIYSHNGAAIASLIAEVSVVIIQLYFTQKFLIGTLRIKNLISYFFGIVLIILIVLATKIFISNYLLLLFISASGGFVVYFLYLYVIKNDLIYYTTNSLIKKILKKI